MFNLQPDSLDWALAHAGRFGDGDVFPPAFEYQAIAHDWANVRDFLVSQNILEWNVRPHRTLLSPKAKYAFRVITQLDPLDFLVFAATILEVATDIEARRVAAGDRVVFSYRFAPSSGRRLVQPQYWLPAVPGGKSINSRS